MDLFGILLLGLLLAGLALGAVIEILRGLFGKSFEARFLRSKIHLFVLALMITGIGAWWVWLSVRTSLCG